MTFIHPTKYSRTLRKSQSIRNLTQENTLSLNDLVYPIFIIDGDTTKTAIESMKGIYRYSIDLAVKEIKELYDKGIQGFALFPCTDPTLKCEKGLESVNKNNLMNRAIRAIKISVPNITIFADVALDPYTTHGHDGVIDSNGYVMNTETVKTLVKQALVQAEAGADFICPSDMMDGRIANIRTALNDAGYVNTGIMSYSAKYASKFYGPFRDAVGSSDALVGDKKTYQMNPANSDEAMNEAYQDITEGADIIMVKPATMYMDIIYRISTTFDVPVFAYQVSGEYAMIKNMIECGQMDNDAILESLTALKRSGATVIFTYFAKDVIDLIK